jgi:hypothetical protein
MRALSTFEGVGRSLDPSFSLVAIARPYLLPLMTAGGTGPNDLFNELTRQAADVGSRALGEELRREGLPVQPFVTSNATKGQIIDAFGLALERRELLAPPLHRAAQPFEVDLHTLALALAAARCEWPSPGWRRALNQQ